MAQHVIEEQSGWEDSNFPRQEDTGVLLGLDVPQVIVAGFGIAVTVLTIVIGGFTWGVPAFIVGLPITAFGGVEVHKRSLISWFVAGMKYSIRGAFGQLAFMKTGRRGGLPGAA